MCEYIGTVGNLVGCTSEFFCKVVNLRKYKKQIILLEWVENVYQKWARVELFKHIPKDPVEPSYFSILPFINVMFMYDKGRYRKVTSAPFPDHPLPVPESHSDKSN